MNKRTKEKEEEGRKRRRRRWRDNIGRNSVREGQ